MCLRSNYRMNKCRAIDGWGTCAPMRVFISVPRGNTIQIFIFSQFSFIDSFKPVCI